MTWKIPQALSLSIIAVIFIASYVYARRQGPRADPDPPGTSDGDPPSPRTH
jgi:hypothetical protein